MTTLQVHSPSQLQLISRPPVWLIAFLWIALAGYLFWVMPASRIRLVRREGRKVEARIESHLFGWSLNQRVIHEISKARVQSPPPRTPSRPRNANEYTVNDTARVELLTSQGWEPVSEMYRAGSRNHQAAAEQINRFLSEGQPATANVELPPSLWLYLGLAFLLFVAVGATFGSWCRCELDRDLDRVRLSWASIPRSQRVDYRLSDVERFLVLQTMNTRIANRGRVSPKHTVMMRLKDGLEVSVTRQDESVVSAEMHDLVRRLNQFLSGA